MGLRPRLYEPWGFRGESVDEGGGASGAPVELEGL